MNTHKQAIEHDKMLIVSSHLNKLIQSAYTEILLVESEHARRMHQLNQDLLELEQTNDILVDMYDLPKI